MIVPGQRPDDVKIDFERRSQPERQSAKQSSTSNFDAQALRFQCVQSKFYVQSAAIFAPAVRNFLETPMDDYFCPTVRPAFDGDLARE